MTFRNHWWLLVPLAAALGCAGSQQAQKETKAGGKSTLVDDGPASASAQNAPTTAQAGTQLVPFQGKNGFVVLMPANPVQDDRVQEAPGGQVQVHIAQAQDPAGKYMTSLSEFPKGSLDRIKSKDLLDSLQSATVQSMGGTLVNARDIEAGGLPGREFTATDPQGTEVTARVFVGESKVYTLAGTYPQGQQIPGSIQQFLGSFQPPPGTAVGGSGSAGAGASEGSADSSGLNNTSSKKQSRRSSSSSSSPTESTSGSSAGSSGGR